MYWAVHSKQIIEDDTEQQEKKADGKEPTPNGASKVTEEEPAEELSKVLAYQTCLNGVM